MVDRLARCRDVRPSLRLAGMQVLVEKCGLDVLHAREMEAAVHSVSSDYYFYVDELKRCALNIHINRNNARPEALTASNSECIQGSLLETIYNTEKERRRVFETMLQEKYESIDDVKNCDSSLKCRRCNSVEVTWEQKQTRGADEAMTVFCVCSTCNLRWTIR